MGSICGLRNPDFWKLQHLRILSARCVLRRPSGAIPTSESSRIHEQRKWGLFSPVQESICESCIGMRFQVMNCRANKHFQSSLDISPPATPRSMSCLTIRSSPVDLKAQQLVLPAVSNSLVTDGPRHCKQAGNCDWSAASSICGMADIINVGGPVRCKV